MTSTLGILAGNGALPVEIINTCLHQGRPVFVLGFDGITDMHPYAHVPHKSVRIGAAGESFRLLHEAGVEEIVLAGSFRRPSWANLMPDAEGAKMLAYLGTKMFAGDDALLKAVIGYIEKKGFHVVGAQSVTDELIVQEGTLGAVAPNAQDMKDIAAGINYAKALGARDAGQAVIVKDGALLGEEDECGTDALIKRCGTAGAILVKIKKPQQEYRADLPAIGVHTVEAAFAAGLRGIALEAGGSLMLEKDAVIVTSDRLKLFIVGVHP